MAAAAPIHQLVAPSVSSAWMRNGRDSLTLALELRFPSALHSSYGAPASGTLEYSFNLSSPRIQMRFDLYNKTSTRLPEAMFVSFDPPEIPTPRAMGDGDANRSLWEMDVLGTWISPSEVADGAAKGLHAIETGVRFSPGSPSELASDPSGAAPKRRLKIQSADAALVRWGTPAPFPTPMLTPVDTAEGASFVLWDNLYNTNYVLWWPFMTQYEDIVFRFAIALE